MPEVDPNVPAASQYYRTPTGYPTPQVDFSWLGNLYDTYLQNQQRQLALQQMRLGMQQSQQLQQMLTGNGQGPQPVGTAPTTPMAGGTGDDPRGKLPTIIAAAQKYGIDPATAIRVARSEGLRDFLGDGGKSGGAFQLYTGGGLGNDYMRDRRRNPLDPANEDDTIDYAMMKASQGGWGPWVGARKIGLNRWEGIGGRPQQAAQSDQLNPTDRAAVDRMYGGSQVAAAAPRPEGYGADGTSTAAPAPTEPIANGSPAPFAGGVPPPGQGPASSKNATGPAGIMLASAVPQVAGLTAPVSPTQVGGLLPQIPQPASTVIPTSSAEVAGTQGQGIGAPTNVPPPRLPPNAPTAPAGAAIPQGPTPGSSIADQRIAQAAPARQPLPRIENDPDIQKLDRQIDNLQRAQTFAGTSFAPNREAIIKSIQDRVQQLQNERTARYNTLKEQYSKQQETEEKGIAGREAAATETKKASDIEQDKLAQEQENKMYGGLLGAGSAYERESKNLLDLSQSMLNDPALYTGALGETGALAWNRVKAMFGDTKAALLQESLRKVTALSTMDQLNKQRFDLEEGGIQGGRVFKQSADLVQQASPQLGTTLAGNRFLVEVQQRTGKLASDLLHMADQWKADHGGRLIGFNAEVSKYLERNPLYSKQELENPTLMGSATIPASMYDPRTGKYNVPAVKDWAGKMGLKAGAPVRTPADRTAYIHVP